MLQASDRRTSAEPRTSARRLWIDRAGRFLVSLGGFTIIASILGILVFIVAEAGPLLGGARVDAGRSISVPAAPVAAALTDEYQVTAAALGHDGRLRSVRLADGAVRDIGPASPEFAAPNAPALRTVSVLPGAPVFAGITSDGRALVARVLWEPSGNAGTRENTPSIAPASLIVLDPSAKPVRLLAAAAPASGTQAVVAQLADGSLVMVREEREQNAITGEVTSKETRTAIPSPGELSALVLDGEARHVFAGTKNGEIVHWPIVDGVPGPPVRVSAGASPVTALTLLIGHRALVVGQADGSLSVWFIARDAHGAPVPTRIRDFPRQSAAIRQLAPSPRDKGFLALDERGGMGLYYSTSHRTLWTGAAPLANAESVFYAPKANGALLAAPGRLATLGIRNPHPEVSLEALFGRVWYEGYDAPKFVWQSSSGSDDFEPKLSLTPLLLGTLKGTFYSLILAIPLGVLGAMYTSQFMHHRLKTFVKPVVEIMAALPSVVLGFLAGLWLAPRIEQFFPALILMVVLLPLAAIAAAGAFNALPIRYRSRFHTGSEALLAMFFIAGAAYLSVALSGALERALFGGRFPSWVLSTFGLPYDQRNAVVVGLAMGFAVIPIIFSVSEEAFSNVPRGLVAGSLALGASRWQTVTEVVLPSASPGIFSAIMIGFGRAIGETMIVLMATGNTPIMSWNPFDGFRTLSANIAVEVPEAPHGGTLYRTLFLAGLLLFVLTFIVNTVAEIVRQKLRRRYASL